MSKLRVLRDQILEMGESTESTIARLEEIKATVGTAGAEEAEALYKEAKELSEKLQMDHREINKMVDSYGALAVRVSSTRDPHYFQKVLGRNRQIRRVLRNLSEARARASMLKTEMEQAYHSNPQVEQKKGLLGKILNP